MSDYGAHDDRFANKNPTAPPPFSAVKPVTVTDPAQRFTVIDGDKSDKSPGAA